MNPVRWYVVMTKPRGELRACANLVRQGFEIYLPKFHKMRRHARRAEVAIAPLFPGYLFVRMDLAKGGWFSINSTFGCRKLVCNGAEPVPLDNAVVDLIRSQEDERGLICLGRLQRFQAGDHVRILSGAFADLVGVFDASATDETRVAVLLNLLGRQVRVTLPPAAIEAAA